MSDINVSKSAIEAYTNCPRLYYFDYFMSPETRPKHHVPQWIRKVAGISLHNVINRAMKPTNNSSLFFHSESSLRKFWRKYWSVVISGYDPDGLLKRFQQRAVDIWHNDPYFKERKYSDWCASVLARYYRDNINLAPIPKENREKRFQMPLKPGFSLVGVIDQIRENGDGYDVIDLKFGSKKRYGEENSRRRTFLLDQNLQLDIYRLLCQFHYTELPKRAGIYELVTLKSPVKGLPIHWAKDIEEDPEEYLGYVWDRIEWFMAAIQMTDGDGDLIFPRNFGYNCLYCDYADLDGPCLAPEVFFSDLGVELTPMDESVLFKRKGAPRDIMPSQRRFKLKVIPRQTPKWKQRRMKLK
jgi:hypothetical protein